MPLRAPPAMPGPLHACPSVRCVSGHLRMRQPLRKAVLSRSCCRPTTSRSWSCSWRKRCKTGCAFRAAPGYYGRGMNGLRPPRAFPGPPLPCVSVRCVSGHLRMRQPLRKAALSRSCCRPMISRLWSCSWRRWYKQQKTPPYRHPGTAGFVSFTDERLRPCLRCRTAPSSPARWP